jgi:hypothetical protein
MIKTYAPVVACLVLIFGMIPSCSTTPQRETNSIRQPSAFENQLMGKWGDKVSSIEFLRGGELVVRQDGETPLTLRYTVTGDNALTVFYRGKRGVCSCAIEKNVLTFYKSKDCPWDRQAPRLSY